MAKGRKSISNRSTNTDRKCGKAWKQRPVDLTKRFTGRTVGGYLPSKLRLREIKRQNPVITDRDVS